MKLFQFIFLILFAPVIFLISDSCQKDSDVYATGHELEFYVLDSFKTVNGTDKIIDSTVILYDSALIRYDQIISYDMSNHSFTLDESAIDYLNAEGGLKYHFKAFAVTIDKQIIYTGYFWPSYASSIKQWFVIDPIQYSSKNELKVNLAYPSDSFAGSYPDLRNDKRLISLLKRDGKLRI